MTIQIAVKLPDDLVGQIDRLVERGAFEQPITGGAHDRRRQELDDRYRAAFLRWPETRAEADDATRLAIDSINEEPWEPWW